MLKELNRFALLATFTLVLTLTNAMGADEDTVTEDAPKKAKSKLSADEIVVTARKREESLQEVPLSISAFTSEKLEEVGAFDNEDVALLTPNFNTERQVGRRLDRPTIRGQAAPSTGAAPNASYFIDGAFVSGSIQTLTLGPIERVEILRGPQSAQFGRATFAGAVNYVTRKPTNEFTGQVKSSVGSFDSATVSGWASGPAIQDTLYYFASASWDTYGGEYRNSLKFGQAPVAFGTAAATAPTRGDNSRLGGTDTKDVAIKFLWTPTDETEITFKASFNKGDDDHYVQLLQETGELNCYLPTVGDANGSPGTVDNSGEVWFTTSPGAFCGTLDPDRVTYFAANPFNPNNPTFSIRHNPATLDNKNIPETYEAGYPFFNLVNGLPVFNNGIAYTLPMEGAPREARYNLPDFYDGINYAAWLANPTTFNPSCFGGTGADCIAAPAKPGTRRSTTRLLTQWEQDFGDWTWLSRVAYNNDDFDQVYDLDRTERRPIFNSGLFHMMEKAKWEDYSFESRVESPGDGPLRGMFGVNYFEQNRESFQRRFPGPAQAQYSEKPLDQNIKNYAVFGSLDYDINDMFTFATELRWAQEDREIDGGVACENPLSPYFGQTNHGESTVKALSPRFTLRMEPTDTSMYYVLAAKGDKPAEFVTAYFRTTADPCASLEEFNKPDNGLTVIKPEKAWTYELGTKQSFMDRRLTANLSVFYINWTNQAVSQNVEIGGTLTQINVNSGKSKVWGAELETNFVFTENLTGQFSYGLANNTFRQYNDTALAQFTGVGLLLAPNGLPQRDENGDLIYDDAANNAKGLRLPGSPKHSFIFGLNYGNEVTLNLLDGPETLEWFARTDFVLETGRYSEANNLTKFPNRKRWNGRLGLESAAWTITAYVNNILDDTTPTGIFGFPVITGPAWANGHVLNNAGGPVIVPADPNAGPYWGVPNFQAADFGPEMNSISPAFGRAYGIELVYRFGD